MAQSNTVPAQAPAPPQYPPYRPVSTLITRIPVSQAENLWYLSDAAFKTGLHLMGGSGTGKSRLLGRLFAGQAMKRKNPLVILDPIGGTIDNFLDLIVRLPLVWRQQLWPWILYVDVGATDYIVPTPLYHRLSDSESLFEIANRLPSVFARQDESLRDAPILGLNALKECATYAGQIAAALGKQVDWVADLVLHTSRYQAELTHALAIDPTLYRAVQYFRQIMSTNQHSLREKRVNSFLSKLLPFLADPLQMVRYSGNGRGIDWDKVAHEGTAVLIDLRRVVDPDHRQFAMLWHFISFTDYIKHRGMAGRNNEILLIIDEVTDMLAQRTTSGRSLLAEDLEALVSRHARNFGVNLIIAHQTLSQVELGIQNILMQMGTQVIGRISNHEDAYRIAQDLTIYDPRRVKKWEPIWMNTEDPNAPTLHSTRHIPTVIDYRSVEYSINEQYTMVADQIKRLDRFQFLGRLATAEGKISPQLHKISIERFDPGMYPDEDYIALFRAELRQASGVPVKELLAEMEQNRKQLAAETQTAANKPAKPQKRSNGQPPLPPHAILAGEGTRTATPAHDGSHSLPAAANSPTNSPTKDHLPPSPTVAEEAWTDEDDVWQ